MITLVLGGGLGNQMFQYAFARAIQEKYHDTECRISVFRLEKEGIDPQALWRLNIQEQVTQCTKEEEIACQRSVKRTLNKIRYLKKLFGTKSRIVDKYIYDLAKKGIFTTNEVYSEQKYAFCRSERKCIVGGFQTYLYWEYMEEAICEELKVKEAPAEENRRLMEEMQSCESVCVHIRRGDYLAPQYTHLNVCNEQYYYKAMAYVKQRKPDAIFYIFTNNHREVEWIKANYDFSDYNIRYVDLNNPDYEELRLMYHCKDFIISNSTFSWWGQMLSGNKDRIVVAPSVWNRQMPADGIYMPFWHLIEV